MPSKKGKKGKGVNISISTPPSSLFSFTSPSSSSTSSLPSPPKSPKEIISTFLTQAPPQVLEAWELIKKELSKKEDTSPKKNHNPLSKIEEDISFIKKSLLEKNKVSPSSSSRSPLLLSPPLSYSNTLKSNLPPPNKDNIILRKQEDNLKEAFFSPSLEVKERIKNLPIGKK